LIWAETWSRGFIGDAASASRPPLAWRSFLSRAMEVSASATLTRSCPSSTAPSLTESRGRMSGMAAIAGGLEESVRAIISPSRASLCLASSQDAHGARSASALSPTSDETSGCMYSFRAAYSSRSCTMEDKSGGSACRPFQGLRICSVTSAASSRCR